MCIATYSFSEWTACRKKSTKWIKRGNFSKITTASTSASRSSTWRTCWTCSDGYLESIVMSSRPFLYFEYDIQNLLVNPRGRSTWVAYVQSCGVQNARWVTFCLGPRRLVNLVKYLSLRLESKTREHLQRSQYVRPLLKGDKNNWHWRRWWFYNRCKRMKLHFFGTNTIGTSHHDWTSWNTWIRSDLSTFSPPNAPARRPYSVYEGF